MWARIVRDLTTFTLYSTQQCETSGTLADNYDDFLAREQYAKRGLEAKNDCNGEKRTLKVKF